MSHSKPGPERLGAFSDGVIAIIITIMVLELKVPHDPTLASLLHQWPVFASYALSYLIVGIIWINHHHLVHYVSHANAGTLWSNLTMLFFVSLIPFFTEYMADTRMARFPTAMYAACYLVVCATFILFESQVAKQLDPGDRELAETRRRAYRRNWITFGIYAFAIPAAYIHPALSLALILLNAALYILPEAFKLVA